MKLYLYLLKPTTFLLLILMFTSCNADHNANKKSKSTPSEQEHSEGDLDSLSKEIVAKMQTAMGGKKAYDAIQHLQWNFFGSRKWWWNKWNGDVRCESLRTDISIVMNIHTKEGQVMLNGQLQSHPDSLSKYLDRGYRWWINDSYWLVMPFKLNDPGIAIQHIGTSFTESDSTKVDVLRLTFDKVGVTPSNMYDLYIDPESNLLVEWSYYRTQNDSVPRLRGPWHKYEPHNGVLFSSDRGGRKIDEISTYEKLPESIYNDLSMTGAEILAKEK